jgi:hypothetical protein
VLRIGNAEYPGAIESMTPYQSEHLITAFEDENNVTISPAALDVYQAKSIITDPIDVAPHMQQAVDSCCDYWLARIRGQKPDDAFTMYQRDLRLAFEQDQLAPLSGRSQEIWHDGGWKSPLKVDRG